MGLLLQLKWSLIAFTVTLVLAFLSMGALGAGLYYLCQPVLAPFYGSLSDWSGDWVWPAAIWAGVLFSISFLAAGSLSLFLEPRVPVLVSKLCYVATLWLGALTSWAIVLATSHKG